MENDIFKKLDFNEKKFHEVLCLILITAANSRGLLGKTKLNKILWYIEAFYFSKHHEHLFGGYFIKKTYGPMLHGFYEMVGKYTEMGFINNACDLIGNDIDMPILPEDENQLITSITTRIMGGFTASSISDLTHNLQWEITPDDEFLPIECAFDLSTGIGDLTDDDINYFDDAISQHS